MARERLSCIVGSRRLRKLGILAKIHGATQTDIVQSLLDGYFKEKWTAEMEVAYFGKEELNDC